MSEPVTPLGGASAEGIVKISEAPLQGMITLRGDFADAAFGKAVRGVIGVDVPARGHANFDKAHGLCWMSPDELLVLCPYGEVDETVANLSDRLGQMHALAVDVSDARSAFVVTGDYAREVIAKLAPVDLSPDVFGMGMFRRSRLAQVPAAFWMRDANTFQIICFRSQARYVFDVLKTAAQPNSSVGFFDAS